MYNSEALVKIAPFAQPSGIVAAIAIVLVGVGSMMPAYISGIPLGADLDNHFRFAQPFYEELVSGNLFPGWLAESNNGFGDSRFRFYPPLLYYMLAAGRALTGDWYSATLVVFTLLSIIGGLGIYLWTRQSFSSRTAFVAAAIFAILPYHLTQFYQASLLAELAAISFLPFAFLFVERISRRDSIPLGDIMGLGVSFGFVILTHIPTTIVGALALGLFALLCTDWRYRKRALVFAAVGVGVALLLSSFFWIKVVTELSWIQAGQLATPEHYDYRNNFLFSPYSLPNLNNYFGSMNAALTVGIFLPVLLILPMLFSRKESVDSFAAAVEAKDSNLAPTKVAIAVAIFALFMTTDLSRPLWAIIPKLPDIQFPFRWLSVVSVVICPTAAMALLWFAKRIINKDIRPWQLAILAISFGAMIYSVWEFAFSSDFLGRSTFTARIEASRGGPSFRGFLPVGASELKDLKPMTGPIDPNGREVVTSHVTSHHRRFTLAAGPATEVRVRTYYYPLWQAIVTTAEGTRPAPTRQAEDGSLLVSIPAESCELTLEFGSR